MRVGPTIGVHVGLDVGPVRGATEAPTWALAKTGGVDGAYDAQAYTNESFTGTVSLEFTIGTVSGGGDAFIVGLSADNPDASYTGIDFGLLDDVGTMYRAENGAFVSLGATVPGDVWKITRTAGTGAVTYYKNGALVSTSSNTSTAALVVDSSLRFTGDTVTGVTVTTTARQVLTWTTSGVTATEE